MSLAIAMESRDVALDLHHLLREMDPARWQAELSSAAHIRLEEIAGQLAQLRQRASAASDLSSSQLAEVLDAVRNVVTESSPAAGLPLDEMRSEWMRFRSELVDAYHELSRHLDDWDIHVPHLRPTNYGRNLLHMTTGTVVPLLVVYVVSPFWMMVISGSVVLWAWPTELIRRYVPAYNRVLMQCLGRLAHPHETHRVNSSTWYCTALFLLAISSPKIICVVAVVVLGFGDPWAAIVGRKWGRTKLINGRSLEGTATFIVVGTLAAFAALQMWFPAVSTSTALMTAAAAAIPAAIAELLSRKVDDNLSIPLSAALGASIALSWLA